MLKYYIGNFLKPMMAPINPPTIAALVSVSPARLMTHFISSL